MSKSAHYLDIKQADRKFEVISRNTETAEGGEQRRITIYMYRGRKIKAYKTSSGYIAELVDPESLQSRPAKARHARSLHCVKHAVATDIDRKIYLSELDKRVQLEDEPPAGQPRIPLN